MLSGESFVPDVSIVIPCRNYARYLPQSLESVAGQTLGTWECLVIDYGSTDDTPNVVRHAAGADPRFRLVQNPNLGLAEARNLGLAESSGRFVQFLDADDLLETGKLERQMGFLDDHPDVDIVYGDALYFDSEEPDLRTRGLRDDVDWMPRVSGQGIEVLRYLIEGNIMVIDAALARRRAIEQVEGFDADLSSMEDWDLWMRCAMSGARFHYVAPPRTRVLVRAHRRSLSRDLMNMLTSTRRVREAFRGELPQGDLKRRNEALLHATEARLGVLEGLNGELRTGLRRLARAAVAARRPAFLLWAAVLPLAAQSFMRPFVRRWRPELISRPETGQ